LFGTETQPFAGPDPDLGPHVVVYGPTTTDFSEVAAQYQMLGSSSAGQFSPGRVAFLFKPGAYTVDIPIGYYTSVLGLGLSPDDVSITGDVRSDAALGGGNATCNFWRSVENFSVTPTVAGRMKWAVAQATPFRRMHVKGNLDLADSGTTPWASGGFVANSKVDGQVRSLTQQQWLTRNSEWGNWTGANWNMAFVGVSGAPAEGSWSKASPFTVVGTAPVIAEKPFLNVDTQGWNVFVPAVRRDSTGTVWGTDAGDGTRIPLDRFYIARAGTDTAGTLNAALASGKHLLLTPGIYPLTAPLKIDRADTVVLGLGFATLVPQGGVVAVKVADVGGVRFSGVMIDAGTENSPVLMEVGPPGSLASHGANPTVLHDLVLRIGNGEPGAADTALVINSNAVIGDHFWIWVADHNAYTFPLPWRTNPSQTGLVVNGDDVTLYGLFVEHFQGYQTVWNGNGGRMYLYQSELPYYPDSSWTNPAGEVGFASYKVSPSVSTHQAWALGIYMVFGFAIDAARAVETPSHPGVSFRHLMTTSIVSGSLQAIVNDKGDAVRKGGTSFLESYP